MDKLREKIKGEYANVSKGQKISYIIGYARDNEKISKQEVLDFIFEVLWERSEGILIE